MNKKLAYYKTSEPYPSFVIVKGLEVTGTDFLCTYDNEMYCRGARAIDTPYLGVNAHGNDFETLKKDGFDFDEPIKLAFYNAQEDKFYQLHGDIFNYVTKQKVDKMAYGPLNLYLVVNPVIGDEIDLNIDDELTEEVITCDPIPTWKSGDQSEVILPLTFKNVENITFEVLSGNGTVYRQVHWPLKWVYDVNPEDTSVEIKVTGTGIYAKSVVETVITIDIEKSAQEGIYSNEYFSLKEENGKLMAYPISSRAYITLFGKHNMKSSTITNIPRVFMTTGMLTNLYSQEGVVTGEYRPYLASQRKYGSPIGFTFSR